MNLHGTPVDGRPSHRSARDLPAGVDLAIVAVPADAVLGVVDDCAAAGVKALVVVTAGFAEVGADGRALQEQLVEKVRGYGMRMVGPNCMGLLNTDPAVRLNASFSPLFPQAGHIALSSQSGALGLAILGLAAARDVGLSQFVSVGNKADVSGNDLLEYWEGDARTRVLLLYLESFGNPRRFARLARRISRSKPIVVVKAGRTRAGSRAAGSHTAALAANDTAVDALFHQSGVIRAGTIDEMFDIATCLDAQPLPKGRRVAIVTNAGGPGILAADACVAAGLTVAEFSPATCARLSAFLPPTASVANPVDMVASAGPDEYRQAIEVAATDRGCRRAHRDLHAGRCVARRRDPGGDSRRHPGGACPRRRREADPRVRDDRRPATRAVADWRGDRSRPTRSRKTPRAPWRRSSTYANWRSQPPGLLPGFDDLHVDEARVICRRALDRQGDGWLSTADTHAVLRAFGFPLAAGAIARSADEAVAQAALLGFPVAAKLASRRVIHKSDIGAVRLNLKTAEEVRTAFQEIRACAPEPAAGDDPENGDGVLIQPMATDAVETIVGVTTDPLFGPLVGFGPGGRKWNCWRTCDSASPH